MERGRRDIFTHVEEEAASVTCSVSVYGIVVQMKGLGSGIVTFSISAYGIVVQMKVSKF